MDLLEGGNDVRGPVTAELAGAPDPGGLVKVPDSLESLIVGNRGR